MFRIHSHHLHLPHFGFDNTKNIKILYAIRVIRDLVNKIACFFIPIFLFEVGRELSTKHTFWNLDSFQVGMLTIATYYIGVGSIGFFAAILAGKVLGKVGYGRSFVISFMMRTLLFLSLYYAKFDPRFIISAIIIDGINAQFFWGAYYSVLSKSATEKNIGKDLGTLHLLIHFVSMISPAISGVLAYHFGIEFLFLIAFILTLVSSILAIQIEDIPSENEVSFKNFFGWLKEKRYQQLGFSFVGRYINDASVYVWPLYIYILIGSIDRVGYLYTISLLIAMIISYFVGDFIDKNKSKKPFFLSGGFLSLIWFVRTQIVNVWTLLILDTVDKLFMNVYTLFFDSIFFRRGKGSASDEFFIYREMIISFSTVVFWICVSIFFIFFSGWQALFIFAGIGVLVSMLIKESKND